MTIPRAGNSAVTSGNSPVTEPPAGRYLGLLAETYEELGMPIPT